MSAPYRQALSTSLFPLLIVGVLAAMSFWLEIASRVPLTADGKSRHDPDYLVEHFEIRRHAPDGALQHTLRARFMQHFPDDDSTEVAAPEMTWHREPPTFVTAQRARLDGEGKHVALFDDVRVVRGGTGNREDTALLTTRLDVFPDDEIATTREPVTITQGASVVRGVGLEVNNKTGIAVLDGPVRGIFHRQRGAPVASAPPAPAPQRAAPRQMQPKAAQPKSKKRKVS